MSPSDAARRIGARVREIHRMDHLLLPVLAGIAAFVALSHYMGNKIAVSDGLGWDGQVYGSYARSFAGLLATRSFDSWYVQRIVPSGTVWVILHVLGKPLTNPYVITGFELLNMAMLAACAVLWSMIGRTLKLSQRGLAIGYIATFLNFAALKMTFFYPVLTDTTAYAFGFFLVYAWLTGKQSLLVAAWLAGAFVFPALYLMGVIFLLLPRNSHTATATHDSRRPIPTLLIVGGYLAVAAAVGWGGWSSSSPIQRATALLGIAVAAVFLWHAISPILARTPLLASPLAMLRLIPRSRMYLGLAGTAMIFWAYAFLSANGGHDTPMGIVQYISDWITRSISNFWQEPLPLVFLTAHLVYFGPALGLLVVWWKRGTASISRLGVGASVVAAVAVIQSLNSESRYQIAFYPIFVIALALASEEPGRHMPRRHVLVLAALSVGLSKVWMWIPEGVPGPYNEWPAQAYFMNQGPWMAQESYVLQMVLASCVLAMLWLGTRRYPPDSTYRAEVADP